MGKSTRSDWGCVQQVDRGRWRLRWWQETGDGYKRRSRTVRGTRRDANDELARIRLEHSADAPCPTVQQCWDRWRHPAMVRAVEAGDMAPRTIDQYEGVWRNHVAPRWGKVPADMVRPLDVQAWLDGMTLNQAKLSLMLARQSVDNAVRLEACGRNPFSLDYDMPGQSTIDRKDGGIWTAEEVGRLFAAVRSRAPYALPSLILCACGSCRVGESMAVRGSDVSLSVACGVPVASVAVVRQLTQSGKVREKLKTDNSRRTVVVPGRPALLLRSMAAKAGDGWLPGDGCGGILPRFRVERAWRPAVERAGVAFHPYKNLRIWWRTHMRSELGIDADLLEKMMGHAGTGVTARHYYKPDAEVFAEALASAYVKHPYAEGW